MHQRKQFQLSSQFLFITYPALYRVLETSTLAHRKRRRPREYFTDRSEWSSYVARIVDHTVDVPITYLLSLLFTRTETSASLLTGFVFPSVAIPGGQGYVIKNDKGAPFMGYDGFELEFCT